MKIGVLSDTHIPLAANELPQKVIDAFRGMDLILHAGDLVEYSVLKLLEKLAKTEAVCGNMDSLDLRKVLPNKKIIRAGNFSIGLIHGYGPPFNLPSRIRKEFVEHVDAIVFGHSHSPMNKVMDGILFFNPGSATDKVFAKYNSYGILTLNDTIKGEVIKIR
ncbi:MAG: metallophosphoesterase family protein, partial [Candidatus Omnitrophica bacterium]|nr:metallophosphoesterase family protein [Candidatus Omnitrophota bacterium]